jgi:tRNA threonylcarbamoyladenosine biosynthesis protein TsaB
MTLGAATPSPRSPTTTPPDDHGERSVILVLDTATSRLVAALARWSAGRADEGAGPGPGQPGGGPGEGRPNEDGRRADGGRATDEDLVGVLVETAGQRHGELLLPLVDRLLDRAGRTRSDIAGVVVGTGPGAFTGLRVGLAAAAGIARARRCPLVGVPTSEAIIAAAAEDAGRPVSAVVLLLPAGPNDRIVARASRPAVLLPAGLEPELEAGAILVAVDLLDRAPAAAQDRGRRATAPDRLAAILFRLARADLAAQGSAAAHRSPTVPEPEYVTLPRGLAAVGGEVRLVRA